MNGVCYGNEQANLIQDYTDIARRDLSFITNLYRATECVSTSELHLVFQPLKWLFGLKIVSTDLIFIFAIIVE